MKYKVTLNGKTYEVEVEKGEAIIAAEYEAAAPAPAAAPVAVAPAPAAAPVAAPAAAPAVAVNGEAVAAPLPGTVVAIKVAAGESVKKGQVLVVIEAMKMENEVMAPHDGVIAQVIASKGAAVQTGDPLVTLG